MQPYNASPRQGISLVDLTNLLVNSPAVEMAFGAEWYDKTLTLKQDISQWLGLGSYIDSDSMASIHRSCTLIFDADAPFNYLSDFIKPYVVLTDPTTQISARFNLGVYTLTSPQIDNTFTPAKNTYTGYDLLQMLNMPLPDSFEVIAGVDPVDAAAALIGLAFPSAQILYSESGKLTTQVYSWPLDGSTTYTYLEVVNTLLQLAGYAPVWCDWDGNFRLEAFVDPLTISPEWAFDLSLPNNTVEEARSVDQDLYDVPNWWRFVMNNLTAAPVEGSTQFTYEDDTANPTSVPSRGRTVSKVQFLDAVDYASLVTAGVQVVIADLLPTETFTLKIFPLPLLWHRDVVSYKDPNVEGGLRQCQVQTWNLPLDASDDQGITLATLTTSITSADQSS